MTRPVASVIGIAVLLAAIVPDARGEITPDQVRRAIDQGVAFLRQQQKPDGSWPDIIRFHGGVTGLCTLALLNAGAGPDDEKVQRALKYLRKLPPKTTYVVSLQTMVLCAAEPAIDVNLINQNVRWLESKQILRGPNTGAWAYPDQGTGDNSNSQFALLALHEAERVGVTVSARTWRLAK
ncbi:MAG: prenyltransferase, partial [Planctomycetales bacterium]|nr:prenyltransferase [Planctomycetales bacterium]